MACSEGEPAEWALSEQKQQMSMQNRSDPRCRSPPTAARRLPLCGFIFTPDQSVAPKAASLAWIVSVP